MEVARWVGFDDLPEMDPVIAHEMKEYGWRGLTANGEVLEVRSNNGIPDSIKIARGGQLIGRRAVTDKYKFEIDDYLSHYNRAIELFKQNDFDQALVEFDAALQLAPTAAARFNRGLVLLSMGRWREGFELYEARLELMTPPMCKGLELMRWQGESLQGKTLLLVHDAGLGDTVMMLRYVPHLRTMGADVRLMVAPELERLAAQIAPVTRVAEGDYYCPMLSLLHLLEQTIEKVPSGPYLSVNRSLVDKWRSCINKQNGQRQIGVAWSIGRKQEGDYPRAMALADLLGESDIGYDEIHSIQLQGVEEAQRLGVHTYDFEDLADCAAFISLMDEIITIDTAAAHLAGAIGHPQVTVLLSHWASWRWHNNPFYPNVSLQSLSERK